MQGGNSGLLVEDVLCTCAHTGAKWPGKSQKNLGSNVSSATHWQGWTSHFMLSELILLCTAGIEIGASSCSRAYTQQNV